MPEGDTVWLTARRLHEALAGQVLVRSDFRVPRYATLDLAGWVVERVRARGKHLLIHLNPPTQQTTAAQQHTATHREDQQPPAHHNTTAPLTIHTHLRMDGSWHLYPLTDTRASTLARDWQVRLGLWTPTTVALGFRLPVIDVAPTAEQDQWVGHLGPDLLGPDWNIELALANVASKPDREIAPALLDQRNLAGIGNLYKCETLFMCGVHPWRTVGSIETQRLRAVGELAEKLLQRNKNVPEQCTTGNPRPGYHHWVYERAGLPCRRCGTTIQRADQPEPEHPTQARSTYWCPHCQG